MTQDSSDYPGTYSVVHVEIPADAANPEAVEDAVLDRVFPLSRLFGCDLMISAHRHACRDSDHCDCTAERRTS